MSSENTHPAGAESAPLVCVLILNWNGWRDTIECLESLLRLGYPRFQVVVCDNASTDGSVEHIAAWARGAEDAPETMRGVDAAGPRVPKPVPCVVLDGPEAETGAPHARDVPLVLVRNGANAGFAAGNNVGLRYALARGDFGYVWLLNPDTVVAPDSLEALVAAAEADPGVGMLGATVLYYHAPDVMQAAAGGSLSRWIGTTHLVATGGPADAHVSPGPEMAYIHGACLLVRTELVRTVGMMDDRYFLYSEEVDWCVRARRAGWRLGYARRARVWHKEGTSMGKRSAVQEFHTLRSRLLLLRRHFPLRYPVGLAYNALRSVAPPVLRRDPERLRLVLTVFRDHFKGASSSR